MAAFISPLVVIVDISIDYSWGPLASLSKKQEICPCEQKAKNVSAEIYTTLIKLG